MVLKQVNDVEREKQERTALSILIGLNLKFSKELKSEPQTYTSNELSTMISQLIKKVRRNEIDIEAFQKEMENVNSPWYAVRKRIDSVCNIDRFNWEKLFGNSLTEEILNKKKEGMDVTQVYESILKDKRLQDYISENKKEEKKLLDKLFISVNSRYAESQTEERLLFDKS